MLMPKRQPNSGVRSTHRRMRAVLVAAAVLIGAVPAEGAMDPEYCGVPGFIEAGSSVKPNIMIMLDNSHSMFNPAYSMENAFDPSRSYYGYFQPGLCYDWDAAGMYYVAGPPAGPGYVCDEDSNGGYAFSGNFMNWAFTLRIEVARKVLVGGAWDPVSRTLIAEPEAIDKRPLGGLDEDRLEGPVFCGLDARPYTDLEEGGGVFVDRVGVQHRLTDLDDCEGTVFDTQSIIDALGEDDFCEVAAGAPDYDYDCVNDSAAYDMPLRVSATTEPAGVIQELEDEARWALGLFNGNHGGRVEHYYGFDTGVNGLSLVDNLRYLVPDSFTPSSEAFYELLRYHQMVAPRYGTDPDAVYPVPYDHTQLDHDPWYEHEGLGTYVPCRQTFILFISDGEPSEEGPFPADLDERNGGTQPADFDGDGNDPKPTPPIAGWPPEAYDGDGTPPGDDEAWGQPFFAPVSAGSEYLDDLAMWAHTTDLRPDLEGDQTIDSYHIYAFGRIDTGRYFLWNAGMNGGFQDRNGDGTTTLFDRREWDRDGDYVPDNFFLAEDGSDVEGAIRDALSAILTRTGSGTRIPAPLVAGRGQGGVIAQAFFQPEMDDGTGDNTIEWAGFLRGLWLDRFGNLREDGTAGHRGGLVPTEDLVVQYHFDKAAGKTWAELYEDTNGDGITEPTGIGRGFVARYDVSDVGYETLFAAGHRLHQRDPDERTIFTLTNPLSTDRVPFEPAEAADIGPHLDVPPGEEVDLIEYIRGSDIPGWRSRTVTTPTGGTHPWKLGDIMHSDPLILPPPTRADGGFITHYGDESYDGFVAHYENRRTVAIAGANDGMLHAFNMGIVRKGDNPATPAAETIWVDPAGIPLGEELWGWIPYNLLPHLKWLKEKEYCHSYFVDAAPIYRNVRIFPRDADHPNGWGTILIVGMRLGCKEISVGGRTYRSAYVVLDVSDPEEPRPLFEYSDNRLGYTVYPPSIARIADTPNNPDAEACWYAIFGSGPTEFDFDVDQRARIYVFNLGATPDLEHSGCPGSWSSIHTMPASDDYSPWEREYTTRVPAYDLNEDYIVDVAYFGTTIDDGADFDGRLMRLVTDGKFDSGDWRILPMLDADGPFSMREPVKRPASGAVVAAGSVPEGVYVFAGTGLFEDLNHLSYGEQQAFYGIRDDCWQGNGFCTSDYEYDVDDLVETTGCKLSVDGGGAVAIEACDAIDDDLEELFEDLGNAQGWKHLLAAPGERVLEPAAFVDATSVQYVTFVPNTTDVCVEGGTSNLYSVSAFTGLQVAEAQSFDGKISINCPDCGRIGASDSTGQIIGVGKPPPSGPIRGFHQIMVPLGGS